MTGVQTCALPISAREIPDLASWRLESTSWVLFPMDETMPIPVMTTRLMIASPCRYVIVTVINSKNAVSFAGAGNLRSRLQCGILFEQPDLQILRAIDNLAVHGKPAIGDT